SATAGVSWVTAGGTDVSAVTTGATAAGAGAGASTGLLAVEAATAVAAGCAGEVCADTECRFSARLTTATMTAGAQQARNTERARLAALAAATTGAAGVAG